MAASAYSGGGRRRPRRGRYRPMAEINVTPMVDVMLVLLVVFMVAAPLLTVGVPVDLPQTAGAGDQRAEGAARHHGQPRGRASSCRRPASRPIRWCRGCRRSPAAIPTRVLYVRGDKAINYGRVLEVMSLVSSAGFRKVSLVAEMPKGAARRRRASPATRSADGQALIRVVGHDGG